MKIKTARKGKSPLQHLLIKFAMANKPGVRTEKTKAVGTKTLGRVYKVKRTTVTTRKAAKKRTTRTGPRVTRVSRP